jgi:hypothetical protein
MSGETICCEDCGGFNFRLTWDGGVYCVACDDDSDGSYGRMADLHVVGDGGPDGPIGPKWLIYPHTCGSDGTGRGLVPCAGCREEVPGGILEVGT